MPRSRRSPLTALGDAPTTERITLDEYQGTTGDFVIYSLHVATYRWAAAQVAGKDVLDLGCGTGYGTMLLADRARSVVGVDVSTQAVQLATAAAGDRPGARFEVIAPLEERRLPFPDDSFDVVTSFQVMEHVADVALYVDEVARVLRPGGTFLCVTPDRTHRLLGRQRPWNEFHLTEFSPAQVRDALAVRFAHVELAGMSARPDMIAHELGRYRRMRLLSYPFTFPGAPERWRLAGIRLAKRFIGRRATTASVSRSFDFGPEDVVIAADAAPSVNVVAIAR